MKSEDELLRDAATRWEEMRIGHFTGVTTTLLGLAAASLGFVAVTLLDSKFSNSCAVVLTVLGSLLLITSVVLALICAWNRLGDMRETARIARARLNRASITDQDRACNRQRGENSWALLRWQFVTFAIGAILIVLAVAIQSLSPLLSSSC